MEFDGVSINRIDAADKLRAMTLSPGWKILKSEIDLRISDGIEELMKTMERTPEILNQGMAYKHWAKHNVLKSLLEWVNEQIEMGETAMKIEESKRKHEQEKSERQSYI